MSFETNVKVRFADVDPAGIVFYPRYFEMLVGAMEEWFSHALGLDFKTMHLEQQIGAPTVTLSVDFLLPSELGDVLTIHITPQKVGRSSCTIKVVYSGEGGDRLRAEVVLACMDLKTRRPVAWPDAVRAGMQAGLVQPEALESSATS